MQYRINVVQFDEIHLNLRVLLLPVCTQGSGNPNATRERFQRFTVSFIVLMLSFSFNYKVYTCIFLFSKEEISLEIKKNCDLAY
jgi:hypothetical protein